MSFTSRNLHKRPADLALLGPDDYWCWVLVRPWLDLGKPPLQADLFLLACVLASPVYWHSRHRLIHLVVYLRPEDGIMHADYPLGKASCKAPPSVLASIPTSVNLSHLDHGPSSTTSQKVPKLVGFTSSRQRVFLQRTPLILTTDASLFVWGAHFNSQRGSLQLPGGAGSLVTSGPCQPNQLAGAEGDSPGPPTLSFSPAGSPCTCLDGQCCCKSTCKPPEGNPLQMTHMRVL